MLDFPHTSNEEAHESGEKYQEFHTEYTELNEESLIERYLINCGLSAINLVHLALGETFYVKHFTRSMCSLPRGLDTMN